MGTTKTDSGFTIIESIFFLAISGLLVMAVLSSVTLTIQRQRYTDSMRNFQSFIQQQFTQTLNVVNQRPGDKTCDSTGINDDATTRVGASDCVILGKLFMLRNDSSLINVFNVVGVEPDVPVDTSIATQERDIIRAYNPNFSNFDEDSDYLLPWGARVVGSMKKTGVVATSTSFNYLAILRSPRSGATMTYAYTAGYQNGPNGSIPISTYLTSANENKDLNICVDSQDILTATAALKVSGQGAQDGVQALFDIDKAQECRSI